MKLYEKPVDRVTFEGKTYPIDADFRNVLRSQSILADNAYLPFIRVEKALRCFTGAALPDDRKGLLDAIFRAVLGQEKLKGSGPVSISFSVDADRIIAAFWQAYGIASAAEQNAGALEQEQAAVQGQLEFLQSGAIEEALEAMQAYEEGVRESIRGTLDGVAGVFDEIGEVNARSAESLMAAVNSQLEYWQDYETNLTTLKDRFAALGISEAIIDQFADGSLESAGIMAGMVEMSDTELQNLAATAGEVDGMKEDIVGELTETRLGLDAEYQTMEDEFDALIASFNQQEAARANVAATATGVTSELAALYEETAAWVGKINSVMSDTGKDLSFSTPKRVKTLIDGSNADGLDYVPFDGYISELHKGEAVLTAREAEVWRTGGASIDYGTLASAVWASAPRDLFAGMPAPQVNVEVGLNGENLVEYVSTQQQLGLQSYNMSKWQPR